jgi:hypothetical protein
MDEKVVLTLVRPGLDCKREPLQLLETAAFSGMHLLYDRLRRPLLNSCLATDSFAFCLHTGLERLHRHSHQLT